jgi:hypothetical protein
MFGGWLAAILNLLGMGGGSGGAPQSPAGGVCGSVGGRGRVSGTAGGAPRVSGSAGGAAC